MQRKFLVKSTIFFACIIFASCEKNLPDCKSGCGLITISGKLYFVPGLKPVANIVAEAQFSRGGMCIGCTRYNVGSQKTSNDGTFSFSSQIDSTLFKDYALSVAITADTNYIVLPFSSANKSYYWFNKYEPASFNNLKFEYYQKAYLDVKLHRTQTDNFYIASIGAAYQSLSFGSQPASGYTLINGINAKDTTIRLQTAANVYTKVVLSKKATLNNPFTDVADSIICVPNQPNSIDISY